MSFNWLGLLTAVAAGALGGSQSAIVSGHFGSAGPGALVGGALTGLFYAQNPHAVDPTKLLQDQAQQIGMKALDNAVTHNAAMLGAMAPLAKQVGEQEILRVTTKPTPVQKPSVPSVPTVVPWPASDTTTMDRVAEPVSSDDAAPPPVGVPDL